MKNRFKASIAVISILLLFSGCASGNDNNTDTSDISKEKIAEITSESSQLVSDSSERDSSVDESSDTLQTSRNSSSESLKSDSSDIGAGEISITAASANNTILSSGSYDIKIGGKTITLSGAYVVDGTDAVIDGGVWNSSSTDQNVFLVLNGGSLTLKNASLTKTGDAGTNDSTRKSDVSDDYNFYGINSVVLVVGKDSSASIENCSIHSDCSGANAVFSLDEANIDVSNVKITTTGNSSRGVYATYGGIITADHLSITTSGAHCAPVATDRGGGYVTVKNSVLKSSGDGSPNIYSTGEITAENCVGISTGAQAAVIEGKNSITMTGCSFTVSGSGNNGVMLYQSMSGDAADSDATASVSTLTMTDTSISCELDAPMFYVTNTNSVIELNGTNTLISKSNRLVSASAGRWGRDGSNGGILTMRISEGKYSESIYADEISSVTIKLGPEASFDGKTDGLVTVE